MADAVEKRTENIKAGKSQAHYTAYVAAPGIAAFVTVLLGAVGAYLLF